MSHWLFLPLDGRPCNARFPLELAALAGHGIKAPPAQMLGTAREPARRDRLQSWLTTQAGSADGLILSLDTWIYGNLVASRKNRDEPSSLTARIEALKEFQAKGLQLHGFATLLRLSNSNDDTEERPYWAQYGEKIYRYSWLEHKLSQGEDSALEAEFAALRAGIPDQVLKDYRGLRARNFAVLEQLLQAVADGLLQTLLIGCDDGGSHGWTVIERQRLQALIDEKALGAQVLLYPGADELACTLLARVLAPESVKVGLRWTYPQSQSQITRYEGLPLNQTVAHQARAAGIEIVEDETAPVVWLHNPPGEQIDQYLDRVSRVRHEPVTLEPLLQALRKNALPLALADVCYANGGDLQLLEQLEQEKLYFRLRAYAAWNTAGNTIGMLLAWFKLSLTQSGKPALQQRFLVERLADDGWYQGYERQQLCSHYSEPVTLNSCIQAIAFFNDKFRDWQTWMPDPPPCLQILHLSFPWKRFFEVDLRVCDKAYSPVGDT